MYVNWYHENRDFIGKCDACTYGIGEVWLSGPGLKHPIVWRIELSEDITLQIVSSKTINGNISISDLEMVAHFMQYIVLEYLVILFHKSIECFSDNTPTIAWTNKLSTKKSGLAGRLLRALAIRQQATKSAPVVTVSIAGKTITEVDNASRSFIKMKKKLF